MSPSFKHSTIFGHCERCPASESRYWITVPRSAASSMENSVLPGTQPSATALSQLELPCFCPTITLMPLSRMFNAWAGPCTPYPSTATTSFLSTSRARVKQHQTKQVKHRRQPQEPADEQPKPRKRKLRDLLPSDLAEDEPKKPDRDRKRKRRRRERGIGSR